MSQQECYAAWVPTEFLTEEVRRGATVAVHLEAVSGLDREAAWFCSMLDVVAD